MKKLMFPIIAALAFLLGACNTHTTERGIELAAQGKTALEYSGFGSDASEIHSCVMIALQERHWNVLSAGNPVKAEISRKSQHAVLSIGISDDKVSVETKGSYIDGEGPYVPLRYVDFLMSSVRKHIYAKQRTKAVRP